MFAPSYRITYRDSASGKKFAIQPTVEHSDAVCQVVHSHWQSVPCYKTWTAELRGPYHTSCIRKVTKSTTNPNQWPGLIIY